MRVSTVVRKLLNVTKLFVEDIVFVAQSVIVHVRPTWRFPRCGQCGKRAPGYDRLALRRWRHLSLGTWVVWLVYEPRRVECPRCGVRAEEVPWAPTGSRFTWDFEELVAYLAQLTDKTSVTKLMAISWVTVGSIVERVVSRRLDADRLQGLRTIGVDEFSYRKRHRYLTVVVDHDRSRIVWAAKGKNADTLKAFFRELGPERCSEIENVTIDMSESYISAVEDCLLNAKIIFDRFHVQRLASDAVDEVRRSIVRDLTGTEEGKAVKKTRFVLLKNRQDLNRREKRKLSEVQRKNQRLYRAYLLKETLAQALDYLQPKRGRDALRNWLAWASRSRLAPFVKTARTIRRHFEGVVAYVKTRLTNGLTEGLNNRMRMVARRAFGFHSAEALIAMLFLNCGGIRLNPPLPGPTQT
jgi:transposase